MLLVVRLVPPREKELNPVLPPPNDNPLIPEVPLLAVDPKEKEDVLPGCLDGLRVEKAVAGAAAGAKGQTRSTCTCLARTSSTECEASTACRSAPTKVKATCC